MQFEVIAEKFYSLLIGEQGYVARESAKPAYFKLSEQQTSRRKLLLVEKQARHNKDMQRKAEQRFSQTVQHILQAQIADHVASQLEDTSSLIEHLRFIPQYVEILDLLAVRAASVGRLAPLFEACPAVEKDILRFINLPKYMDMRREDTRFEDLRLAMSYMGMDNLKLVIPAFILKNLLPHSTEPFRSLKRQMWDQALGSGLIVRSLAMREGVDPYRAFVLGLFKELGHLVIVRVFLRSFDLCWRAALASAHKDGDVEGHEALSRLKPEPQLLRELMLTHNREVTANLVGSLGFERLNIHSALLEYAAQSEQSETSARLLKKADAYMQLNLLQRHDAVCQDETQLILDKAYVTQGDLNIISDLDLSSLNLKFDKN